MGLPVGDAVAPGPPARVGAGLVVGGGVSHLVTGKHSSPNGHTSLKPEGHGVRS